MALRLHPAALRSRSGKAIAEAVPVVCWGGPKWLGLAAIVLLPGCATSTAARLYPEIAEQSGARIDDVRFRNPEPFTADSLLRYTETKPSRCNFLGLPFCVPFTRIGREEHRLSVSAVARDVEMLERFYRISGYFGTTVTPSVAPDGSNVDVTFAIARGDAIYLDALSISGTEGVLDPDSLEAAFPLGPGDLFNLNSLIDGSERIVRALQERGHPYAQSFRSFTIDTLDNRAEASLDVIPGPRVIVDSIIVTGAPRLGRSGALRQIEIREGDVLRRSRLIESERNLYSLELVSLASVTIAPDSLQKTSADSATATVLVAIVEAPLRQVETALGFGTVECLRTEGIWVHRSFQGGGRRLALQASLARLGVGEPFSIRGGERVCPRQEADSIFQGNRFDYRYSADFTQPYFLNPRNQFGVSLYAERLSEPGVFIREAYGGRVAVSRRLGARSGVSGGVEFEQGQTLASPGLFCATFFVCNPSTIDSLSAPLFRAEAGVNYLMDATDIRLDPTAGYMLRTSLAHATPLLGSDLQFVRWTGDISVYREPRRQWVVATGLRLGNFFQTATTDPDGGRFLPPAERFYAGGASTVRGYRRNSLGDGVYVTDSDSIIVNTVGNIEPWRSPVFVPTGGTSLAITNLELRTPSPFWSDRLRLAFFVDAGALGNGSLLDLTTEDWRVTPGVGIRVTTPVGPLRIDVAVNPYPPVTAPLFVIDSETGGLRRVGTFTPGRGGIFSRMQLHLGVGNAF